MPRIWAVRSENWKPKLVVAKRKHEAESIYRRRCQKLATASRRGTFRSPNYLSGPKKESGQIEAVLLGDTVN